MCFEEMDSGNVVRLACAENCSSVVCAECASKPQLSDCPICYGPITEFWFYYYYFILFFFIY